MRTLPTPGLHNKSIYVTVRPFHLHRSNVDISPAAGRSSNPGQQKGQEEQHSEGPLCTIVLPARIRWLPEKVLSLKSLSFVPAIMQSVEMVAVAGTSTDVVQMSTQGMGAHYGPRRCLASLCIAFNVHCCMLNCISRRAAMAFPRKWYGMPHMYRGMSRAHS